MITEKVQSELKHFLHLNTNEKVSLLHQKGLLLDSDVEKESRVNLFYINGFFVEEILNRITSEIEDLIPYKSGYKLETYLHRSKYDDFGEELRNVG